MWSEAFRRLALFFEGGYIELSIGERIYFFRNKRGLTQEQLGRLIGLPDNSADVRITQYESGSRKPKDDVIKALAEVFGISPFALSISDIDDPLVILHTLFAMEDIYGAWVEKNLSAIALNFDPYNNENAARRSEERRVGKECTEQCRSRWSPYH